MRRTGLGACFVTTLLAGAATTRIAVAADVKLTDAASIDAVIAAMTPEEKARFVVGMGMNNATAVPGVAGSSYGIPRLGIPEVVFSDGPVGLRLGGVTGGAVRYTTAFPVSAAMAATWNPALVAKIGSAIGAEAKAFGVDVLLGPALNIQRNPLNGRNFEYFSEDPYLAGMMTTAYVEGIQATGVGATLKHFAANNQETNRMTINEIVPERALREIYLPAFEMAVKQAKPWAVMSAYPSINGTFASQSAYLLTEILRKQWGFDGFVMSDWFAVKDPVAALKAGNDLIMPGGALPGVSDHDPGAVVLAALQSGALPQSVIDENIRHMLGTVVKTPVFNGNKPTGKPDLGPAETVARTVAEEGLVLLKNDGHALPLAKAAKVALFGHDARAFIIGGGGSAQVNADPARIVSLQDGFKKAGLTPVTDADGADLVEGVATKAIARAAAQCDVAVVAFGRNSAEGADRFSMAMLPEEVELVKAVSRAFHAQGKKVVVLLNVGAAIEVMSWRDAADAILLTWLPGEQAGVAVADVVAGKVNPSGKLPTTFLRKIQDSPSFGNFPGYNGTVDYGEGIYVGYRYYDTKGIEPAYAFGHGLSYTTFRYDNARISTAQLDLSHEQPVTVSVDVTNSGKVRGQEVAQLYVHEKATPLDRPYQELKGFQKVELDPGETRTLQFTLNHRDLASFDPAAGDWVIQPGHVVINIGSSSRDIRTTLPLRIVGTPDQTLGLRTPWITVQGFGPAAAIVAHQIGEGEVNGFFLGNPTLGDRLQEYFARTPSLKDNPARQKAITDEILAAFTRL
ncbi:MAG: glycoside hydrolase family 3 N-terminal domain-containing protein [Azospirillaceae bacterium]|nr:glycoside hydrolase family 3 N-terminal domain-containing protein [Azospirillaceae bacterium]